MTIGRVIAELVVELDRVFARRTAVTAEIEEAFLAHPFGELLSSMPGIGPRTGSRILAEIGDGSRFDNGDKLASYAGLAPVTRPVGQIDQRRVQEPKRQPPAQERHVPRRVRVAARPGLQGVLRPQTRRMQAAQRRDHLSGPQALQRHPGHAATQTPYRAGHAQPDLAQAA